MIKRTYLIGMLAAGPGLLSCTAAADEISPPVQMSFFHTRTARDARPVPGDEDKFLSLLRDNIASGGPPKDG